MTQEMPPIQQASEALDTSTPKVEAAPQQPLTLEEIKDGAHQIDEIKKEELRQDILSAPASKVTPYGTLSPEGRLFVPDKEATQPKKSKTAMTLGKIGAFLGIASVGITAANAQALEKTTQHFDNAHNKIETVISHDNEDIHPVTETEENTWNEFLDFLNAKHLRGSEKLNHADFSKSLIEEFNKTAETPLEWSTIKSIQHAINQIKKDEIAKVKAGKAEVVDENGNKVPVDMLMANTSPEDGIPGAKTTSYQFPHFTNVLRKESKVALPVAETGKSLAFTIDKQDTVLGQGLIQPGESK